MATQVLVTKKGASAAAPIAEFAAGDDFDVLVRSGHARTHDRTTARTHARTHARRAVDEFGNLRTTGGDVVDLAVGVLGSATAALDGGDGSYRMTVAAQTAGRHLVSVTLNGEPAGDAKVETCAADMCC